MINCKNCIQWVDESLNEIEADRDPASHIFMGCRIFGNLEKPEEVEGCKHYVASENLFTICNSCHLTIPKLCVSLGECVNCTDTDLFCVDSCIGDENRKYCSHFVRLHAEGIHLISKDQVFDLYPILEMPGQQNSTESCARSGGNHTKDDSGRMESQDRSRSPQPRKG